MAAHHGKDGVVMVGAEGAGGTNPVAKVYDWTLEKELPTEDATAMGDQNQDHLDGIPGWTGSVSCRYDEADTLGQEFLEDNARADFKLYAIGSGTGKPFRAFTAIITNVRDNGNYQGIIDKTFDVRVRGAVSKGVDP